MSTSTIERRTDTARVARPARSTGFSVFTGLTALTVLLQAVWAGIFLQHDGERDAAGSWIDVHARGGEVALLFAVVAVVFAFGKLRSRRELLFGSIALAVLLIAESYLGGLVRDQGKDTLTAVHVPLGMAIMALSAWLPVRSRYGAGAPRD